MTGNPRDFFYASNGVPELHPAHKSFATLMGADSVPDYARIDQYLSERGIAPTRNARYSQQREIAKAFLSGTHSFTSDAQHSLQAVSSALIDLAQIWAVIVSYGELKKIPGDLRTALFKDSVTPLTGKSSPGRDLLSEYYAGARFKAAGCEVIKAEPDFQCKFSGVGFGLAVKRLHIGKLEDRIRSARSQIERSGRAGIIVLDLTQSAPFGRGEPFVGQLHEYRATTGDWMEENFYGPLRMHGAQWGLDQRITPYVCCFHFGCAFLTSGPFDLAVMSQLFSYFPDPKRAPLRTESDMISAVHAAVMSVRKTLPESNHYPDESVPGG